MIVLYEGLQEVHLDSSPGIESALRTEYDTVSECFEIFSLFIESNPLMIRNH